MKRSSQKTPPSKQVAENLLKQGATNYTKQADESQTEFMETLEQDLQTAALVAASQAELKIARLLNLDLTQHPEQFIPLLEKRIQEITGCAKSAILLLDENSGTYRCLNDEAYSRPSRELTWVSDHFLQELLKSESVIYAYLADQNQIFGIVAIADKVGKKPLALADQLILEQMSPYLAVQVKHYLRLKEMTLIPAVQKILLNISSRLLGAVDSTAIFQNTMEALLAELPFTAAQYIELDKKSGKGKINYQLVNDHFIFGKVIKKVDSFAAILSLFKSQVWKHPYLQFKGQSLGDTPFSELFGLDNITNVLVLPIHNSHKEVQGALVLFQQNQEVVLSDVVLHVLQEVVDLVNSAKQRARVLEKALEIATTDELTRTLNRRGFYTACHAEVDRARRNQRDMVLSIIDLDHFKTLNDTYGHLVGDTVLRKVAERLLKNIRKSDIICRFGGEEFTLLLPETSLAQASELLERLRQSIERVPIQTSAGPIKATFSGGLAEVPLFGRQQKLSAMEVISRAMAKADKALYDAKKKGRNQIAVAKYFLK